MNVVPTACTVHPRYTPSFLARASIKALSHSILELSKMTESSQLMIWEAALEGARVRQHQPSPSDVSIPWSVRATGSEVCTTVPDPSSLRVTLFLRTRLQPLVLAQRMNSDILRRLDLQFEETRKDENDNPQVASTDQVSLLSADGGRALTIERTRGGVTYGSVLAITSLTAETRVALERIAVVIPLGESCLMRHDAVEMDIETVRGSMKLVRRTGVEKKESSAANLVTIFELKDVGAPSFDMPAGHRGPRVDRDVVSRCVVGYKDGSPLSCVGPSISSISVRRDYQGCALIQDLFNAVERWFVESWWMSTMSGSRVLKGTKLEDLIVDRVAIEASDGTARDVVLTDKLFFYEFMGFVVNRSHAVEYKRNHASSFSRTPPEAEALKYYPPAGTYVMLPTVNYVCWSLTRGWRSCDQCGVQEGASSDGLLVCDGCNVPPYWRAHYCSKECQRLDWGRHKLFCRRTYGEVCKAKETYEKSLLSESLTPKRRPMAKRRRFWLLR